MIIEQHLHICRGENKDFQSTLDAADVEECDVVATATACPKSSRTPFNAHEFPGLLVGFHLCNACFCKRDAAACFLL